MNTTTKNGGRRRPQPGLNGTSFPVYVNRLVGEVTLDQFGEHTPIEAAFLLIARTGEEGAFSFPIDDQGRWAHIEVGYDVGEGTPL